MSNLKSNISFDKNVLLLMHSSSSSQISESNRFPELRVPASISHFVNKPEDAQAFKRSYQEVHLPLARNLPGLQRYTVSRNTIPQTRASLITLWLNSTRLMWPSCDGHSNQLKDRCCFGNYLA